VGKKHASLTTIVLISSFYGECIAEKDWYGCEAFVAFIISHIRSSQANQNDQAIKNMRFGMIISIALSILLRLLFRRASLPPSKGSLALYILVSLPSILLARYLEKIGTNKRDPVSGALISSGEDLNQPGLTELCFDVLYVTCTSFSHLRL
jgi:hypothetical protein